MIYVDYCLFSSYEIPTSIGEVLWSLGSGMGYLGIAPLGFKDVSEWVPRSSPR